MLCKVGSIIMTVAINALYLPFVDFYALALLASRFLLRLLRPAMLAYIAHHDKSMLQFVFKRLDILAPVMPSIDS